MTSYAAPTLRITLLAFIAITLSACGINNIPTYEEQAKAQWSQVLNQYKRRNDLIPNLVETVKGFAEQEKDVLTAVVEARAKATQTTISPDMLTDPAAMKAFSDNQAQLSSALSRLLVTVERYPDIKSGANFLALQSQLEGTENRIGVARRDYIEAVRIYNTELKTLPGKLWADYYYTSNEPLATFDVAETEQANPTVDFNK